MLWRDRLKHKAPAQGSQIVQAHARDGSLGAQTANTVQDFSGTKWPVPIQVPITDKYQLQILVFCVLHSRTYS